MSKRQINTPFARRKYLIYECESGKLRITEMDVARSEKKVSDE